MPYLSAMGLFRRNTKYRVMGPPTPALPGREFTVTLHATRVREGTTIATVYADVECSGRKDVAPTQGEGLQASSVSSYCRVTRREIDVKRTLARPEDTLELAVALPWWTPVVRVGEHRLMGTLPRVEIGYGYGRTDFETEAMPFHHALFAAAAELGWSYQRCQIWDVGGRKRPVEQQLWFTPGDGYEAKGFKLAHVEVVPIARSPESGDLQIAVFGRKLGPGLFPLGRLDAVPLTAEDPSACVAAVRTGLTEVIGRAGAPAGVELDGQVLEAVLRVLLRG
jgi:hypothetical protein